jgi:hypothetical protein
VEPLYDGGLAWQRFVDLKVIGHVGQLVGRGGCSRLDAGTVPRRRSLRGRLGVFIDVEDRGLGEATTRDARRAIRQAPTTGDRAGGIGPSTFAPIRQNGWHVRYGYVDQVRYPPPTALVMIGGVEFARFVRDEGHPEDGKPQRFSNRHDAFEATLRQRMARQKLRKAP